MQLSTADGTPMPRLGLGTWRLGESQAGHAADVEAVATALRLGYRLIDTAEMYGEGGAERVVGDALRRAAAEGVRRESLFVVSKVYPHRAGGAVLREACEASLQRLGIEQLDLYLLHWRGSVPLQETASGKQMLVSRGLIRHWGVSNFDVDDMEELHALRGAPSCVVNQIYLSLGQRGAAFALLPWLRRHGVTAMAYSPIDQGSLSGSRALADMARPLGLSAAQLALAWVLRQPGVVAIPKAAREPHLRENLAAASIELGAATLAELDRRFPPPSRKTPLAMT